MTKAERIDDLLAPHLAGRADALAMIDADGTPITWDQYGAMIDQMEAALRDHGLQSQGHAKNVERQVASVPAMSDNQFKKIKSFWFAQALGDQGSLAQQFLSAFGVDVPTVTSTSKFEKQNFWDYVINGVVIGKFKSQVDTTQNKIF